VGHTAGREKGPEVLADARGAHAFEGGSPRSRLGLREIVYAI